MKDLVNQSKFIEKKKAVYKFIEKMGGKAGYCKKVKKHLKKRTLNDKRKWEGFSNS